MKDDFKVEDWALPDSALPVKRMTPTKVKKRREHFVCVPMAWLECLEGASGKTYSLALHLLYRHWKAKGEPFRLANGMLEYDGIGRHSKWRALGELERLGLISVERRAKRSPVIRLFR